MSVNNVELPDNLQELEELIQAGDTAVAAKALEKVTSIKGRGATRVLADYLRTAPMGLLATRAAISLENRQHKSCLPILYEVFQARPELAEDIVPIFSAMEDDEGVGLIVDQLNELLMGPARLSTLAYLIKCADHGALIDVVLPRLALNAIPGGNDDLRWAMQQLLSDANDALLAEAKITAQTIGPEAMAIVKPYLPAESELEKQAPAISRALIEELERTELIELVPDSDEALVEGLTNAILEARSPKGLIRDVERILLNSAAIEEVYADREDLKKAFAKITSQ